MRKEEKKPFMAEKDAASASDCLTSSHGLHHGIP